MKEKQSCLGKIIDVQKMMIDEQSRVIRDMTDKMTDNKVNKFAEEEEVRELKGEKKYQDLIVKDDTIPIVSPCKKVTPKNFRQLYQKALDKKKVEDIYEEVDEDFDDDDDDNDSFITINSSDEESDYTLENSESSDSGIIEHDFDTTTASYGVNPLFSKHSAEKVSTISRACKEFVYKPQREDHQSSTVTVNNKTDTLRSQMVTKPDLQRMTSIKRSQRKIVIMNDESAMIVNESCLI